MAGIQRWSTGKFESGNIHEPLSTCTLLSLSKLRLRIHISVDLIFSKFLHDPGKTEKTTTGSGSGYWGLFTKQHIYCFYYT